MGEASPPTSPPKVTKAAQNNAARFRQTLEWQEHIQRKKKADKTCR